MNDVEELLERCYEQWKYWYGVISIRTATKFVKGIDTGIPCITFYVFKKTNKLVPRNTLSSVYTRGYKMPIPREIGGILTDVVELSTSDYILGTTSVSNQSPDEQKRKASGVRKE